MSEQILKDLALFSPEIALTVTLLAGIAADLIFRRTAAAVSAVVMAGRMFRASFAPKGSLIGP